MLNTSKYGYMASLQALAAISNPKREVNHHEDKKNRQQHNSIRTVKR